MKLRKKPSGIYVVDFVDEATGVRQRVSTGTRDPADAKVRAREIVLGINVEPPKVTAKQASGYTMKALFNDCLRTCWHPREVKAQRTLLSNLRILELLIGDVTVPMMTFARLKQLQQDLLAQGYAPATVKRKMDTVSRALREAVEMEVIAVKPPMPSIKVRNLRDRVLTEDEETVVFEAIADRVKAEPARQWVRFGHLIRFLLDTACRLSEPLQSDLSWYQSIQNRAIISIPDWATKTNKHRIVPLSAAVVESMGYLRMTAVDGKPFPLTANTVWFMWANIRDDLKDRGFDIGDVTLHTLRHTCLTRLVRGGMAIHLVSMWAGHADVKITMQRYAHLQATDLMSGLDILNAAAPSRALKSA